MPTGTFREYVETVRASADIAQVVGDVVKLRGSGQSLSGLCPFHPEKTPSFSVSRAKGVYYCFGCAAGGDVFRFVMDYHHVDFTEAVGMIGDRIGIPRPAPSTPQEAAEDRQRRRALEALERAQEFFFGRLFGIEGQGARAYLERRGLSAETARSFGLGYAPPGWDNVLRMLASKSYSADDAIRSGLAVARSGGEGAYDRYRDRITFPIRDTAGRVVSFGGRAVGNDEPKYLNGPETTLYDKGRTLFRLGEVTGQLRRENRAIVVEGYFDAIGLAAAGVPGVVAVCGTAFGPAHARLLRRHVEQVVLFFDSDKAGRQAVHRALGPCLAEGLQVRVATNPDGKDPDDLAREGGQAAVDRCLASAVDLPGFLVGEAKRAYDLGSMDGRVKALDMILGHLVHLNSPLARAEAADRVSEGLVIADDLVRTELRRAARARRREVTVAPERAATRPAEALTAAEKQLLRYLVGPAGADPAGADAVAARVPVQVLTPTARAAFEGWLDARRSGIVPDLRALADVVAEANTTDIHALAFAPGPEPDREGAHRAVDALCRVELETRKRDLQERLQTASDPREQADLASRKLAVQREINALGAAAPTGTDPGSALQG